MEIIRRARRRLASHLFIPGGGKGQLRIESDGTRGGTIVSHNGERISNVQEVAWHIDAKRGIADAVIHVKRVHLDVEEPADEAPVQSVE